jgi:hypothetical protein
MPDGYVRIRQGERRPLYGQVTAQSGTLTVQSSPAPTCTLYDANGTAVGGLDGIGVSGYDAGAQTAPRVWYNLDTTAPANLAAGFYTLVFKFAAQGSDGILRVYKPSLELEVQPPQA